MKEETIREWGKIHPLGMFALTSKEVAASQTSPTPENLIYHFTPSFLKTKMDVTSSPSVAAELMLVPPLLSFPPGEGASGQDSQAIAIKYGHPRFIEYDDFDVETPTLRPSRPVFPILLAAVIAFVVWYIYHLTGQQLKLQTDAKAYLDTLVQEQQAKAEMVAPQIKVLLFEGRERGAATAKLFWNSQQQEGQIYFDHLPEATALETYQLWFVTKDTQFVRANAFRAVNGKASLLLKLPPRIVNEVDRIVLSLEPPSEQLFPTGKILLRGRLR